MASTFHSELITPKLTYRQVANSVLPTIVSIYTKIRRDPPAAEMFGPFMFQPSPSMIQESALGSGVIVSANGFIVTNDHVIEKADKIKIVTADEQQFDAEAIIRDSLHDLAIVRILHPDNENDNNDDNDNYNNIDDDDDDDDNNNDDNNNNNNNENNINKKDNNNNKNNKKKISPKRKNNKINSSKFKFPCIKLGRAEIMNVGDVVLAIGNNLGFRGTVTDGIISAIGRTNDVRLPLSAPQFPLIQTNASINQGSSGGALVNLNGELIGINEAIATSTGGNVGVGFAVPVNFVQPLLRAALESKHDIQRVWDGITAVVCPFTVNKNNIDPNNVHSIQKVHDVPSFSIEYGRAYPRGIRIKSLHKESPAFEAGLKKNDIIYRINNTLIDDIHTYYLLIMGSTPDDVLTYHILRNNKQLKQNNNNNNNDKKTKAKYDNNNNNNARNYLIDENTIDIYENTKLYKIDVRIKLIPIPKKKPYEIKDRLNPFYGAELAELGPALNSDFGLDFSYKGIIIYDIERGSQAYRLGFRIGDIILAIDNERVKTLEDVEKMGEKMQSKKSCRIKFKRGSTISNIDVFLRTRKNYSKL